MQERRKEQRRRVYLGGRIVAEPSEASGHCIVRDSSPSGARLALARVADVPDEFALHIPHRQSEMRVRARWRRLGEIGVEVTRPSLCESPISLALVRRLRRLETNSARLKRRLDDITE